MRQVKLLLNELKSETKNEAADTCARTKTLRSLFQDGNFKLTFKSNVLMILLIFLYNLFFQNNSGPSWPVLLTAGITFDNVAYKTHIPNYIFDLKLESWKEF